MNPNSKLLRRDFLKSSTILPLSTFGIPLFGHAQSLSPTTDSEHVIGPKPGFSPHVGTLASMMTWMRSVILRPVAGMATEQLDFVFDEKSNSIGSMLLHLAATERFYQIHTFDGKKWGDWSDEDADRFGVAMRLGDEARKQIKGNDLSFYLNTLEEVRATTLAEFKKRDDDWLLSVDDQWFWGPTNNYCKWFHVCEHESNHNGQIKWLKSRLPA